MRRIAVKKSLWHHFDSPLDMQEWIGKTPRTEYAGTSSTDRSSGHSWDLGADMADTVKMITAGWNEGAKTIRDISREQFAPVTYGQAPRARLLAVQGGGRPVTALVNSGYPLCFQRIQVQSTQQRVIRLWVSVGARAYVTAQTLMSRGVATLAAIDAYEAQGVRVEVTAATNAHSGSNRMLTTIRIKEAGERLQKQRVAFPIAHPAFFRRMIFAVRERRGDAARAFGNYGATDHDAPVELPTDAKWVSLKSETTQGCFDELMEELKK